MVDNTTVLQACYLAGSTDFQQRVPDPSQHSVAQVQKFLFQPMNKKYRNEFIDLLFNVFAVQMVHQRMYRNPLKKKRADIDYGTTVQEIALDFCKAHSYKDDWGHRPEDITNLLKVYRPTGEVAYHSVNRYDQYPISINDMELRGAFQTPTGLNALVNAVMNVPYNSGEYDEYQYYKQIIAEHEYYHGFYKHHMDARPNDETTGKEFLRALRMYADLITVPTKLYNATDANVPVWINEDERASMVLYLEADVKATLDVDTLSSVFHLDKAESPYRIQFIDSIPIPGAFALLTTEDFWMCADYDVSTEDFRNPQTKTTTYYYTVIGMYSASPFVPAILFTTAEGTTPQVVTQTTTGLTVTPATANVARGGQVALVASLTGTLAASVGAVGSVLQVAPDSVTYALAAETAAGEGEEEGEPLQLDVDTYVDRFGILHVGSTVPVGATITVTLTTTYVNPSGETTQYDATATITVTE